MLQNLQQCGYDTKESEILFLCTLLLKCSPYRIMLEIMVVGLNQVLFWILYDCLRRVKL